ncbi:histidine kinase N-terminal 7TM domain-containing protein [Actibacterium sp. D379-3]
MAVVAMVFAGLAALTRWVWRQRRFPGKRAFLITHWAMLWWLLAAGMELASDGLGCKVFWAQFAWPGIVLLPTAWAMFLYDYAAGGTEKYTRWRLLLLIGGPGTIALLALSNDWHHLFYGPGTRMVEVSGRLSVSYDHGPLFYVAAAYDYAFMVLSMAIAVRALRGASPAFRGFFVALLVATLGPIMGNLAYVVGGVTFFGFDPTPFMFALVLSAFGWLVMNNSMMDINGIARDILFYNSDNPILIADPDGRLVGCNPEAHRVFGKELPQIGDTLEGMAALGPIVPQMRSGGALHKEAPLIRDGRAFDPRLRPIINPLTPTHPALGWLLMLVDITAQQRAAVSLRLAADQAQAASDAKTQFLSTVSHELRTPLTSIKGTLDLLNAGVLGEMPPEMKRVVQIASNNSNRLRALIDDLLDLSKIESGAMAVQLIPIDLAQLLRDAAEANEGYGKSLSVSLRLTGVTAPVYVKGDHARLMQVMANVLSNALKFSEPGDVVEITLEQHGPITRISVRDEGIGIPEGAEDKVFGHFTQVDASDTRKKGGSGLGMNIAQRILELHGGSIHYTSKMGVGTTFFIDLPVITPD